MYVSNEQITYLTADCIANFIDKRKLNTLTKLVLTENFTSFTIFFTSKTFFWWIGFTFFKILRRRQLLIHDSKALLLCLFEIMHSAQLPLSCFQFSAFSKMWQPTNILLLPEHRILQRKIKKKRWLFILEDFSWYISIQKYSFLNSLVLIPIK